MTQGALRGAHSKERRMRRMMHPQHGWHVVSAGDDIAAMRKAGWVDDDGKALAAKLGHSVESEGDQHLRLVKEAINKTFPDPRDAVRAELDARGIKWDRRWGLDRLNAAKG